MSEKQRGCCAPAMLATQRPRSADPAPAPPAVRDGAAPPAVRDGAASSAVRDGAAELVTLEGGWFRMGSDDAYAYQEDGEGPVRSVRVEPFRIAARAVSNRQFARFVRATGYVTSAERYGTSFVFSGLLPEDFPPTRAVAAAPWWREVPGACWWRPEGSGSTLTGRADHPVVHVGWDDALAYCDWSGLRLPTEAEWEYAARGGLDGMRFPWGDMLRPDGEHRMNVWQGRFPAHNTLADGYLGTAPVGAFPPNGFGLYNMTGNVWEWTADRFGPPGETVTGEAGTGEAGTGEAGTGEAGTGEAATDDRRALRGGSYLCHASYCYRYRVSARMANTPDSCAGNMGFRCAAPA